MSEVVPLPSFGEVFFDSRGQDRVLRVTWHEGTLVLSLWRGEMCTASFRMPLEDVGRLIDTLDDGYAEAGGDQLVESGQHAVQYTQEGEPYAEEAGDYPQTGHYARPGEDGYQHEYQAEPYAETYQEPVADERPPAAHGPNDVLVARGTPAPDKLVAGYGTGEAVPRENLIVGDSLQYGQPEQGYQPAGTDPAYARRPGQGGGPATDPYGFSASEVDEHGARYAGHPDEYAEPYGGDGYTQPPEAGAYGRQVPHPDPYGTPGYADDQRGYDDHQPAYGDQGGYDERGGYPPAGGGLDPHDPLGLGQNGQDDYYQSDTQLPRPYLNDGNLFATGERLRPEQGHDDRYDERLDERGDRRDW